MSPPSRQSDIPSEALLPIQAPGDSHAPAGANGHGLIFAGWIVGWIAASLVTGSLLLSFHQPFRTPGAGILALAPNPHPSQPRILHVLLGSCGCSQKIMQHLAARGPWPHVSEQVLIIDSDSAKNDRQLSAADQYDAHPAYLPGSVALLQALERRGFAVIHISAHNLPRNTGLRGVPLLVFASSRGDITYLGGYGPAGDQDTRLLRTGFSGPPGRPEPVFGCAVGARLQQQTDPFRLKYSRN